jgi:hypothetical protein
MKEKKRLLTLPLRCYGKPQGDTAILAVAKDVVNTWQSNRIDTESATNKAKFNDCQHYTYDRVKYGGRIRQEIVPTDPYSIVATNDFVASLILGEQESVKLSPGGRPVDDRGFRRLFEEGLVTAEKLKQFSLFGARKILPQFKKECSVFNFLFELKDLPHMIRQVKSVIDYLRRKHDKIDPRLVPNSVLAAEFGWLPFVNDILSIARALGNYRKQIKQLIKDEHKIRISSVHKTVPSYFLRTDFTDGGYPIYIGPSLKDGLPPMKAYLNSGSESLAIRNRRLTFTIKYSYWIPDLTKSQVELRGLLQSLGVEWNPKIVWDALPYSFLVDWVTDIGAWLEQQFARPTFEVSLRVHEFCISEKCSFSYDLNGNVPTKWDPPSNQGSQPFWYTSKGKYFRRICNSYITKEECLVMPWRGLRSGPGLRKLASFLSLIVTNAKAAKKRKKNIFGKELPDPNFINAWNRMPRWWRDSRRAGAKRRAGQGRRPRRVRH